MSSYSVLVLWNVLKWNNAIFELKKSLKILHFTLTRGEGEKIQDLKPFLSLKQLISMIYPWFPLDGFNFDGELSVTEGKKFSTYKLRRGYTVNTSAQIYTTCNLIDWLSWPEKVKLVHQKLFQRILTRALSRAWRSHAEVCSRRGHSESWSGERKGNKWECSGHSS